MFLGGFCRNGLDFNPNLNEPLPNNWTSLNDKFITVLLERHPDKTRVSVVENRLTMGN